MVLYRTVSKYTCYTMYGMMRCINNIVETDTSATGITVCEAIINFANRVIVIVFKLIANSSTYYSI